LAAPVFTGDAQAVTPTFSDNDTSIATTAYVKSQFYRPATGDPLTITADTGNNARIFYTRTGAQTWAAGCLTDGSFFLSDETVGAGRLWITPTLGVVTIGRSILVGAPTGGEKGVGTVAATGVYANNTLLTSDVTLKTEIEPLPAACLPLVAAVEPKSYRWREPDDGESAARPEDFSTRRHSGFLAQDLADAAGELPGIVDGKPGEMAVDVGAMLAVLWQAVRELSAKVETLEAAK